MMYTIHLTDAVLKQAILSHLVNQIDQDMDKLLASGMHPEFIDDLRKRPARDLGQVVQNLEVTMEVSLDPNRVMSCLTRIDRQRRDAVLMEHFIGLGASAALMRDLFKLSKTDLDLIRDRLDARSKVSGGRTKLLPEPIRDDIHLVWQKILTTDRHGLMREQLYTLHQQFSNFGINSIWAAIGEFNDLAPAS